ncbi:MAG: hypothetical protein OEU95_06035, partial [Nitrospirota bacterium]|nr:hypothetical protein [Nitrospirota bacterium]
VSLMLKMANEVNFQTIKMTDRLNSFYETHVPEAYLPEDAMLDYYISACDAQNNCETSGSPEAPHHIRVISLAPRTEGYVLQVDKKRTMISIGSMDGVHKGDHYIVFRTGKEYRDPGTNELLFIEEILVGTLKIKELMPKTAYADIDDSFVPFETNDRIRKQASPPREAVTENIHSSKIVLRWAPNPEPEVKGYHIYRAEKPDGDYRRIAKTDNRDNTYYEDKDHMKEGLTFYYRVAAVNMLKTEGIMSEPVVGRTKGAIQPPAEFRTDGTRVREVSLRWKTHQNDPDMDKYVIFRSESESGNFSEVARAGKSLDNYRDRDRLQDGKTYYYRIASYSKYGSVGAHSPVVTAKTKELPAPPENIRAESGAARRIKLQWSRHTDKDVAGYIIYRNDQEKGNYTETGKTAEPEYIDNDLPDGKTYYYTVASYFSARADEVRGQPSGPVSAVTKQRPKAPQNAAAQSGLPKKTVIKWDRNGEKDISEYLIYRGNNSKLDTYPYARVKPDVSAFTDNGLKNNATYLYAVRAVDADGLESDLSETLSAVTKPLPSNPAGLSGQMKGGKVLLSWKPNPEQDIKGYNVYKKKWFGSSLLVSVDNSSCEISPDDDGKSIKLFVTAIDRDALESEPSEIIEVILKQ